MNVCITRTLLLGFLALILSAGAFSAQPDELFQTHVYSDTVLVEPGADESFEFDVDLIVSGPKGFYHRQSFPAGSVVEFDPSTVGQGQLPDGTYKYELRIMGTGQQLVRGMDQPETASATLSSPHSGAFTVKNGSFLSPDEVEPVADVQSPQKSGGHSSLETVDSDDDGARDVVHADDLIVQRSLCVGFDCVNGESFGFDTIRMKENNTRIKFEDTSAGAFPSNDWELTANDSTNGGLNRFSILDVDAARNIFTVEAGARLNSLYVESDGDVGLGTNNPVIDLHIVTGNTPGMRLEQDGSSGFTPQTWDIAGNESNFFVRDATNGSALPFRIQPGAASNVIYMANDEQVGFGTTSPTAPIDINAGANIGVGNSAIRASNSEGAVGIQLDPNNDGTFWLITANSDNETFRINRNGGTGDVEFEIDQSTGNLTIPGAIITGGGMCGGGCDFVFNKDYELPSIEEHAKNMWDNGYLPNVGPTPENEPINLSDKAGRMLNELETAHIYIEQLHERLAHLEERLETLESR